jgi:hypothetical protein
MTSVPSRITRASLAPRRIRSRIAADARPREVASRYLPRRISVMIVPAVSKYTSSRPATTAHAL